LWDPSRFVAAARDGSGIKTWWHRGEVAGPWLVFADDADYAMNAAAALEDGMGSYDGRQIG
jgi:hypothetical protein